MDNSVKIAVIEPDVTRERDMMAALKYGGLTNVIMLSEPASLAQSIVQNAPDIVLIDLTNPDQETVEHMALVSGARARPVVMFVNKSDAPLSQIAIDAGLSAYVVDGLQKDRIKPVLETAMARFQMISRINADLIAARKALEDRKTLDRAKGLLMRARGLSEEESYSLLRRTAMDQNRKVTDVAAALVTAADLLT